MKTFYCDHCTMMVFFENDHCVKCESRLGFLPDVMDLSSLIQTENKKWRAESEKAKNKIYRLCANGEQYKTCNWMVADEDPQTLCVSCRLNQVIPDLSRQENLARWQKLEFAKRRCIYTFLNLHLPLESNSEKDFPLRFRFMEDQPNAPVQTGHENGLITVNIAEADADERESRRLQFHEPYRTLIGHFRHECGHFYWDRLIANSPHLKEFRELFGDETADYSAALQTYYKNGPAPGWEEKTVTAYASSHPWEDWAETWAHYLHIIDTLETAADFGLSIRDKQNDSPKKIAARFQADMKFEDLWTEWLPLTCALNSVNRGMGLSDLYPFVVPPPAVEKLKFIHEVVHAPKTAAGIVNPIAPKQTKQFANA